MVINSAEGYLLSDNVVSLLDYKSSLDNNYYDDCCDSSDMEDPIIIGWVVNDAGEKELNIASSVNTICCLWMIDLAKKIVESRPPEIRNDNE